MKRHEQPVVISKPDADGYLPMYLPRITANLDIGATVQQPEEIS
jgi:hypothetical protein